MEAALAAGAAIYNAGRYHAAHDAWEERWLDLESGTQDERFLHGLIQFTAAVHHARNRNWSGATGLATSAREYLDEIPTTYRGVNVGDVRVYLRMLGTDPEIIERRAPLSLRIDGDVVMPAGLDFEATAIAASVYAEADGYDVDLLERAGALARADATTTGSSPIVSLVFDFVREPAHRDLITSRLAAHVDRRETRAADVDGLFD